MNKILLVIFFTSLIFYIYPDAYDDAMKYEAKGDLKNYKLLLDEYFKNNINNEDQEDVIKKLFYSATLFNNVNETIDFLIFNVKYIESNKSRQKIYIRIAELNELLGNVQTAGIYYEKASYVIPNETNYITLLNSIEMLFELGFLDIVLDKLLNFDTTKNIEFKNKTNSILCRIYFTNNELDLSKKYLSEIDTDYSEYGYLYNLLNNDSRYLNKSSLDYEIIKNPLKKLRTPLDYYDIESEISSRYKISQKNIDYVELLIGSFDDKMLASGTINIIEQMGFEWFLDFGNNELWNLYIFTNDKSNSLNKLKEIGIVYE